MKKAILLALFALWSGIMFAQNTVTGTVTASDDGSPIPFANVQVEGTTNLVFTDDNGKFSIEVPADGNLIISFMGFKTQKVAVNGKAVLNIVLQSDSEMLEETIVVAYGTAKKGTYTGAASVLKAEAIADVPTTSFENALNGKIAGLQITQSSGQAGSASSIRIRGIGSMNASNEPLYVIDGIPVNSGDTGQMSDYVAGTSNNIMNTLNPSDIESITVLKDAAASSLYGSRAANGVILVTTKRGKMGKPTVTFKASVGITPDWAYNNYEVASPQEQAQMEYEIFWDYRVDGSKYSEQRASEYAIGQLNSRFGKHGYKFTNDDTSRYAHVNIDVLTSDDPEVNARLQERKGKFYDWEKELFRTAVFQSYDLSVAGGTESTKYYSSFAYTSDKGRAITNEFSRLAGRVNVAQKVGKHVEFETNINLARTEKEGFNDTRNTNTNYFMQVRNLLWPFYWPTNYKTGDLYTDRFGSLARNHVYYQDKWENSSVNFKVQASEKLTVHILDGLDLTSTFSYDNTEVKDQIYYSAEHFSGSSVNGSIDVMSTNYEIVTSSTLLNFNKTFKDKHTLSALVGFEAQNNKTVFQRSSGENLPTSALNTVSTAGTLDANAYRWGSSIASIISKVDYNYDGRYYISGSYRRDGSSKLAPDARWGDFWSVAASWKINNEAFMRDIDWISNLRIRGSYGINGTFPSDNYGWRALASYTYKYNGNPGSALSNVPNENLSWETSYTTNVALEFGFWDQRLYGTIEYYNRDSKDLLQNVPISTVTGFSSTLQNIGEINNRGWEFEIGGDIIRSKDWNWSASFTGALLKSEVTELYGGNDIIWSDPTGGDARCQFIYREGESTLSVYGYEWAGVNPENGMNVWYLNDENVKEEDRVDDFFMYNGRRATYTKTDAEYKILADLNPKFQGGFSTNVSWKGIDLGLNFTYKLGSKLFDAAEKDVDDDGYYWERIRSKRVAENRWKTVGQVTDIPQISGLDLEDAMGTSSRHLHSGNFLRLKNISLSYNFPKQLVNKIGLGSARVYFNGQNLLTFAGYKEVDPEVNEYGTRGWEIPFGKTYTFGLEFTF
ncbi:MAG: TonB-dependent receptor [Bacteroidales bacterium]|nr:TonB-dependent receptor [Bacteroidales bacterium]